MNGSQEIYKEMGKRCRELDHSLDLLRESAQSHALAESTYKHQKAEAYLNARGTVAERNAQADLECTKAHFEALLAEGLWRSAQLAVRSRQQQISALQSMASAYRAEAQFAQTGPQRMV